MGETAMSPNGSAEAVVLSLSCPDRPGIVHAVSSFVLDHGGDIRESQQFADSDSRRFFMRMHIGLDAPQYVNKLREAFTEVGNELDLRWTIDDAQARQRVLLMVSKFGHCLNDLLFRWQSGQLPIDIPLIVSNHIELQPLAATYRIPFVHIPVTRDTKAEAEGRLKELVHSYDIDLVVLARYMQILSDDLCTFLDGRAINIHHSFLPGFKGARPYEQAWDRGVKLVGATAHYVTADLDEGPIIEQEVLRVNHAMSARDLVVVGRDAECIALARAVQWHAEHRVLRNGSRTVVFR
jgi:formyltetrahydrofolate deformylase